MQTMSAPPVAGLTLRAYRPDDIATFADLINAASAADGLREYHGVEEIRSWFSRANEHFDPERDAFVAEIGGRPIAYTDLEWIDTTDGIRELRVFCSVHPDWRRQGIGTWLQGEIEAKARARAAQVAQLEPTDKPHWFGSWNMDKRVGGAILLQRAGFQPVRYFFDMLRPTMDDIVVPPLPEGLEIRPVAEADYRRFWDADVEAFLDHWGGFDGGEERYRAWLEHPHTDPTLWIVAWDGDEIAGGVINTVPAEENAKLNRKKGWLASVFTRRQWRKRGLASALVARSLVALRDRGLTSAGLGVDAANPTGALGIYERAGFEVEERSTAWRKPFEAS